RVPGGLQSRWQTVGNSGQTIALADGTPIASAAGPAPRWGMAGALAISSTLKTPSGLSLTLGFSRTASLSVSGDPFSLSMLTDVVRINTRPFTTTYNALTRE